MMSEKKENLTQNKEPGRIKRSFTSRQFKSGAYSSVITVIVIALVVVVNMVFNKLDLSTDLTSDSLFTLTKDSQKVLKDVKDDITIYYMVTKGEEQDYIKRVIKQYNKVSNHIKVVTKDPVVYPNFSRKYVDDAVSDNDVIVVDETTGAAKYVSSDEMLYSDQYSYYTSGSSEQYLDVEGQITSAIQNVLSTDKKKIYVVTGHDEQSISDSLSKTLEKMNVDVQDISLVTQKKVPDDCSLLIEYGPQSDLRDSEKTVIMDYLKKGGTAILMPGYVEKETPNIDEILDYYGMSIQKGIIYEGVGHYENYLNWIVPTINTDADVMSKFDDKDYVVIGSSQSIKEQKASSLRNSLKLTDILTTSKQSLLKKDPSSQNTDKEKGDLSGPFTTGVYAEETVDDGTTKLTVIATNEVQDDLMQNVISGMLGDSKDGTTNTSIEAKSLSYSTITMSAGSAIVWSVVLVILVPLALLLTGFAIWFTRRRK
jgi:ABC-2 type transport system permease protein